jgi:AcrR family transcriptional regulator
MDQQPLARPIQRRARGMQRIASILDAAEAVFAEVGYDEANTNRIAAQAGISPGSLYHFFSNKEEITQALAARYTEELENMYSSISSYETAPLSLSVWLNQIIHALVTFHLAHPAFQILFSSTPPFLQLASLTHDLHQQVQMHFERGIQVRAPILSTTQVALSATMCIQLLKAVLPLALQAEEADRKRLVDELKSMLFRYLDPILR